MPELFPVVHMGRALKNGNTPWNMGFSMRVSMALDLSPSMCTYQTGDEILLAAYSRLIDVLIDCFMANGQSWMRSGDSSSNDFRRPALA
jgi:hypothetical protein